MATLFADLMPLLLLILTLAAFQTAITQKKESEMKSTLDKMLEKNTALIQSDFRKVVSHVQRDEGEWLVNTLMIEGCDTPFKYKRKKAYKNLTGQRVNLTYYVNNEKVAGIEMEIMKVVRLKRS